VDSSSGRSPASRHSEEPSVAIGRTATLGVLYVLFNNFQL
jgi:hypothetical protein